MTNSPNFIPGHIVLEAEDAIVESRNLCGDERYAVETVAADNGIPDQGAKLFRLAYRGAQNKWRSCQAGAGVPSKYWVY